MSGIVTNVLGGKGPDDEAILFREGDIVAERYEVKGSLGHGGMGTVYLVLDRVARENRAMTMGTLSWLENMLRFCSNCFRLRF